MCEFCREMAKAQQQRQEAGEKISHAVGMAICATRDNDGKRAQDAIALAKSTLETIVALEVNMREIRAKSIDEHGGAPAEPRSLADILGGMN